MLIGIENYPFLTGSAENQKCKLYGVSTAAILRIAISLINPIHSVKEPCTFSPWFFIVLSWIFMVAVF